MWQMPQASVGASGSREKFFQPVSSQVIWHNFCNNKNQKWAVLLAGRNNCQHVVSTRVAGCDRSLSRVSRGARANNCHGSRLALIRHWLEVKISHGKGQCKQPSRDSCRGNNYTPRCDPSPPLTVAACSVGRRRRISGLRICRDLKTIENTDYMAMCC